MSHHLKARQNPQNLLLFNDKESVKSNLCFLTLILYVVANGFQIRDTDQETFHLQASMFKIIIKKKNKRKRQLLFS